MNLLRTRTDLLSKSLPACEYLLFELMEQAMRQFENDEGIEEEESEAGEGDEADEAEDEEYNDTYSQHTLERMLIQCDNTPFRQKFKQVIVHAIKLMRPHEGSWLVSASAVTACLLSLDRSVPDRCA